MNIQWKSRQMGPEIAQKQRKSRGEEGESLGHDETATYDSSSSAILSNYGTTSWLQGLAFIFGKSAGYLSVDDSGRVSWFGLVLTRWVSANSCLTSFWTYFQMNTV